MTLQFYASEWTLRDSKPPDYVTIRRMGQISGPDKFSVNFRSLCLNKNSEWEFEPIPSSRDDEFLERCRFDSFEEAVLALEKLDHWTVKKGN